MKNEQKNKFYISKFDSPIGELILLADAKSIKGVWFNNQTHFLNGYSIEDCIHNEEMSIMIKAKKWLDNYFSGNKENLSISLKPKGTDFQLAVWNELSKIPYGSTSTYKIIGDEVKKKLKLDAISYQAVGQAVGKNPISILVPCHRIIGSDGTLVGYAGGLGKKRYLLNFEGVKVC